MDATWMCAPSAPASVTLTLDKRKRLLDKVIERENPHSVCVFRAKKSRGVQQ